MDISVGLLLGFTLLILLGFGWANGFLGGKQSEEGPPSAFLFSALRILFQLPFKKSASSSLKIPQLICRDKIPLDPASHAKYARVCSFTESSRDEVKKMLLEVSSACYLEVLALPYQIKIISDPRFPLQGLGLIHIRNEITQYRPFNFSDPSLKISLSASVATQRWTDVGLEIDFVLLALLPDDTPESPLWKCVMTLLSRAPGKGRKGEKSKEPPKKEEGDSQTQDPNIQVVNWQLKEKTGRDYAQVSGDFNPHHLYKLTALPFGFPGPIAHGMFTLAKAFAHTLSLPSSSSSSSTSSPPPWTPTYPFHLSAHFKRPLVLPANPVLLKVQPLPSSSPLPSPDSVVGILPPPEIKVGDGVSVGVYSKKGVPHMKACFYNLK